MRYTRNRQMRKLRKDWPWRVNVQIGTYYIPFVDKSFKWHRDLSHIGFQGKNWVETERSFIKVKGNYKL